MNLKFFVQTFKLSNFLCITDAIIKLKKSGFHLRESLESVQHVNNKLSEGRMAHGYNYSISLYYHSIVQNLV